MRLQLFCNMPKHTHWSTISGLNNEHKILDERNLFQSRYDFESRRGHLREEEEVERDGVDLQVPPLLVSHNLWTFVAQDTSQKA